jgi:hypothetical protein
MGGMRAAVLSVAVRVWVAICLVVDTVFTPSVLSRVDYQPPHRTRRVAPGR